MQLETILILLASAASLLYIFYGGSKFIYYVLIYNILVDVLSINAPAAGIIAQSRAIVLYVFLFYVIIRYRKINAPILFILVFSLYAFILNFFSSDITYSLRIYIKVIISILYFIVGYSIISDLSKLRKLLISVIIVMLIMIANTILVNIMDYRGNLYSENQLMSSGNLFGQFWNTASYCILLTPLIIHFEPLKFRKKIIFFTTIVLFLMMLFNLSRIPIISLICGYIVFAIYFNHKKRLLRYFLMLSILLFVIGIFFYDLYLSQIQLRKNKYEIENIETEARYLETSYVFEEVFSFTSFSRSLFGKEFMNSGGNYANGIYGDRQLHIDYNNLLHGSGIIGLSLYLSIFLSVYYYYYKKRKNIQNRNLTNDLVNSSFIIFLSIPLIISLSGQMYSITFRLFDFLFLGAFLRLLTISIKYQPNLIHTRGK